jgi:hypothetical protein
MYANARTAVRATEIAKPVWNTTGKPVPPLTAGKPEKKAKNRAIFKT